MPSNHKTADEIIQDIPRFLARYMEPRPATVCSVPVSVVAAVDEGRLRIAFPDGKPSREVRSRLKKHGFKWAPGPVAWQCPLTRTPKALEALLDR